MNYPFFIRDHQGSDFKLFTLGEAESAEPGSDIVTVHTKMKCYKFLWEITIINVCTGLVYTWSLRGLKIPKIFGVCLI